VGTSESSWISVLAIYSIILCRQRPLTALEEVPTRPDPYSSYKQLHAWASVATKVASRQYTSGRQFEVDIFRLFEKARRQYNVGSQHYGWVLMCQRFYQLLTLTQNPPSSDTPLTMSSIPGPRRAQPLRRMVDGVMVENPQGFTSYDVLAKGRDPAQQVVYKVRSCS
jgi:chromatin structure-remodeling complex subunit RSC1/2